MARHYTDASSAQKFAKAQISGRNISCASTTKASSAMNVTWCFQLNQGDPSHKYRNPLDPLWVEENDPGKCSGSLVDEKMVPGQVSKGENACFHTQDDEGQQELLIMEKEHPQEESCLLTGKRKRKQLFVVREDTSSVSMAEGKISDEAPESKQKHPHLPTDSDGKKTKAQILLRLQEPPQGDSQRHDFACL